MEMLTDENLKETNLYFNLFIISASVSLSAFMARRALQEMVTPFTKSATTPWVLTDQPFGRCCDAPSLRCSAWQGRCHYLPLRLDMEHHSNADTDIMSWLKYYV